MLLNEGNWYEKEKTKTTLNFYPVASIPTSSEPEIRLGVWMAILLW
jgi:hypothetical protein